MRGMTTTLRFGDWAAMQADAKPIRMEVFVQEQNVPADLEMDERDVVCLHAVAYDAAGRPLGTGRLLPDGHIGRMAVLRSARGAGVGGAILKGLMEKARAGRRQGCAQRPDPRGGVLPGPWFRHGR